MRAVCVSLCRVSRRRGARGESEKARRRLQVTVFSKFTVRILPAGETEKQHIISSRLQFTQKEPPKSAITSPNIQRHRASAAQASLPLALAVHMSADCGAGQLLLQRREPLAPGGRGVDAPLWIALFLPAAT